MVSNSRVRPCRGHRRASTIPTKHMTIGSNMIIFIAKNGMAAGVPC